MGTMSIAHWLVVMIIILLVASTGKLKNVGKELGEAIRGFKESVKAEQPNQEKDK
jgi:sec-independent protein translocase protein TatA